MQKIKFYNTKTTKIKDPNGKYHKIVGYFLVSELRKNQEILERWFNLNPRLQNLATDVSKAIKKSFNDNDEFHLLNRGILFSAQDAEFDDNHFTITFDNDEIHGNVDGGHTLKVIFELSDIEIKKSLNKYVYFEIITGINSKDFAIEIAEARNTSAAVDMKSIENLKGSFDELKHIIKDKNFKDRISWKMFEKGEDSNTKYIDVRDLIALMNVFNDKIYDPNHEADHPIQSYSGKSVSLKKFILKYNDTNLRNKDIEDKKEIWDKIFDLWDEIEKDFHEFAKVTKKQFATKYTFLKWSEIEKNGISKENKINTTTWNQMDIIATVNGKKGTFKIPGGLIYPVISGFRALVSDDGLTWDYDPITVWKEIGSNLVISVIDQLEKISKNPVVFAKTNSSWDSIYSKVKSYKNKKQMNEKDEEIKKLKSKINTE